MKATTGTASLLVLAFCLFHRAEAIPSFAQQTGQPCSACHVGAFGPQLKPYGRDFKLYGYTSSDGQKHLPTIALTMQSSYTQTHGDQEALVGRGYKANDNILPDEQISAYYGGRLSKDVGAFIQVTYDEVTGVVQWDNMDVRFAHLTQLLGQDTVFGFTLNNNPTVQDLWNSTPGWGFPYNTSSLAPSPAAATLADGTLAGQVIGTGGYAMWNDLFYVEGAVYRFLSRHTLDRLGVGPSPGQDPDTFDGAIPYGRIAIEHGTDHHYFQAGMFALEADRYPGGDSSTGTTDRIVDRAIDANYQFTGSKIHFVSAHAIYIQEEQDLRADQILNGTLANDRLHAFRADVSYSYRDTWTPSVQFFQTTGSTDAALWGTPNGSPDTRGFVAEIAFVPWGKRKSLPQWMNLRIAAQYVSYQMFDGTSRESSLNNTVYLSLWIAVAPLYGVEKSSMPKMGAQK
ncbi:MAG: cytochrome C [Steroidobacteraceae bacterium]